MKHCPLLNSEDVPCNTSFVEGLQASADNMTEYEELIEPHRKETVRKRKTELSCQINEVESKIKALHINSR